MSATASTSSELDPSLLSWNQELSQTIQHLAIQNMHLFKAQRNAHRKLQQCQLSHGTHGTEQTSLHQDKCIGSSTNDNSLQQIEILMSEKAADAHKIEVLTSQLKALTSNCQMQDNTTQTNNNVNTDYSDMTATGHIKAGTSSNNHPLDIAQSLSDAGSHTDHDEVVDPNDEEVDDHVERNKIDMAKFKEDLSNKREARHRAIFAVSMELERLRGELTDERMAKELAQQELQELKHKLGVEKSRKGDEELAQQLKCVQQMLTDEHEKNEVCVAESKRHVEENEELANRLKEETLKFEQDREYSLRRVKALKDVAELSKQMLEIRENQVTDLKAKVKQLETIHGENTNAQLQTELVTQMKNIKTLKALYEDRVRVVTVEKDKFSKECEEKSEELAALVTKCSDLEIRLAELETSAAEREELNTSLQTRLDLSEEESKGLSKEITLINSMFTQMLVGNSSTDIDLDKLTRLLQENHDLITEMTTKEEGSETAASLPKLLLDLISQIDKEDTAQASTSEITSEQSTSETVDLACNEVSTQIILDKDKTVHEEGANSLAVEEIASNLPKVWRVLMELLSHHVTPTPTEDIKPSCYKCIDTPSGPRFVPSVSNTYIRLKDLILEKKSLQKDLGKLKQLNGHLESKLHEQEKRLSLVSAELRKTWGVVGHLRSQFRQLHTHEQILRYELQQKRHLLTELKNELEYCREKWERARQKDRETEIEWKKLRKEFAARKRQDQSNSGESGFSDERENESGDETGSPLPPPLPETSSSESQDISQDTITVTSPDSILTQEISQDLTIITSPDLIEPNLMTESTHLEGASSITKVISSPDISWITLLKLRLIFNRDNLAIPYDTDPMDVSKALDSIFALPPIEIPNSMVQQLQSIETNDKTIESLNVSLGTQVIESSTTMCSTTRSSTPSNSRCRDALGRTPEEALAARADRLKRLEEQTQLLFNKVTRTTNRSVALSNRLEELHEQYGVPNPPPLPPILPALRIPVYDQTQQKTDVIKANVAGPSFAHDYNKKPSTSPDSNQKQILTPTTYNHQQTPPPSDSNQKQTPSSSDSNEQQSASPSDSNKKQTPSSSDSNQQQIASPSDSNQQQTPSPSGSNQQHIPTPSNSNQQQTPSPSDSNQQQIPTPSNSNQQQSPSPSDSNQQLTPSPSVPNQEQAPSPSEFNQQQTTSFSNDNQQQSSSSFDSHQQQIPSPSESNQQPNMLSSDPILEPTPSLSNPDQQPTPAQLPLTTPLDKSSTQDLNNNDDSKNGAY